MQWYVKAMKNYAKFDGRATRQEYWMFYLFNLIFMFGLLFMGGMADSGFFLVLFWLYYVAIIVPTISVTVRRLHDIGKSGAAIFLNLIPFAGPIIHLVQVCTDSQEGDNKYGPNPKTFTSFNDAKSQVAATSDATFCGQCGQKTPAGKFCVKCGKELTA